jgi:hypothetical protein
MAAHKQIFFGQFFIFWVLNFGTKTAAEGTPIIA